MRYDDTPDPAAVIYAVVQDFDAAKANAAQRLRVQLSFVDDAAWKSFSIAGAYVLVETPGYWTAVEPVLAWLRDPERLQRLPLRADLLQGSRSGDVEYVRGTRVDLTCLYKLDAPARSEWRDCDPLGSWPTPELLEVDDSQQHALRHILTERVAL